MIKHIERKQFDGKKFDLDVEDLKVLQGISCTIWLWYIEGKGVHPDGFHSGLVSIAEDGENYFEGADRFKKINSRIYTERQSSST